MWTLQTKINEMVTRSPKLPLPSPPPPSGNQIYNSFLIFVLCVPSNLVDDSVNAPNMRRPLTGKLIIRVSAVKDVDHASTSRFSRSPETSIVIKIEDVPRQRTKSSRTDKWGEEYEIPVDKANEIEFTVYDKISDQSMPIGFLWVRISDIAEELRRRRIEQIGRAHV